MPSALGRVHCVGQGESPSRNTWSTWLKSSFPHHYMLVAGDIRSQLVQLADLLGVEKVFNRGNQKGHQAD